MASRRERRARPRSTAPASRSASVVAASDSSARSASTLRISGWSISGRRTRCGAGRGGSPAPAPARMPAAEPSHAVQPGHRDHLDDRPDAPALLADQPGHRVVELRLAAGVAAVAQLVLEPLDAERVAAAVRQHPGHQEAATARRRLGQHQEQVAHRRAGEPLVPAQPVRAVRRPGWPWWCWPGRRSRPASRSCPCRRAARACVSGVRRPGSYAAAGQQRLVPRRPAPARGAAPGRPRTSSRSGRRGRPRPGSRRTARRRGPRARPAGRSAHGRAGQALADRDLHQLVPGRVELDLVDAVAVPVVGEQARLVPVGLVGPALRLGACRPAGPAGAGRPAAQPAPSRATASSSAASAATS